MEIIRVGIWLDDAHFAHALSMGLARTCRRMIFTLMTGLEDGQDCDLILTAEEMDDPRGIVLVRDENEVNIYGDPPYRVYRYKESDHLINDLLFVYFNLTGKNLEFIGNTKCKLLAFASVAGGCGCTATALSVGQMLHRMYGGKCLYLNLCPIDDSKKYLPEAGSDGLRNLLYYLDVGKDFPLASFIVQTDRVDAIRTSQINAYFDELDLKLLRRLLKKIDDLGQYSFLILDMSNHLSRSNKQLLTQASQIILMYQEQEMVPENYFDDLIGEIRDLAGGNPVITVKNFGDAFEEDPRFNFVLSRERDGRFVQFNQEAGAIARRIMEDCGHD